MRRFAAALLSTTAAFFFSIVVFAKGRTVKITIHGANLQAPVEITDAAKLAPFGVWSGPGVWINGVADWNASFADWKHRAFPYQTLGLPRYEVSFYSNRSDGRVVYTVTYTYDRKSAAGFIYIPGGGDPAYQTNVLSIRRGVEGNWFRASSAWDSLIGPLLAESARPSDRLPRQ